MLETTNHNVDIKVIELINRWRKKEAARGSEAGHPMRQVYTQVRSTLPTMKEFSCALSGTGAKVRFSSGGVSYCL